MTQLATHEKSARVQEECKQQQDLQKSISPSAYTIRRGQMFHKPVVCDIEPFNQLTVILRVSMSSTAPYRQVSLSHCPLSRSDRPFICYYEEAQNRFLVSSLPYYHMRGFNKVLISWFIMKDNFGRELY